MAIAILSLLAGILTVLAPCVLPFLPIIVGGTIHSGTDKRRPYLIAASLVLSLLVFTLLLKASTIVITINPRTWEIASGSLIILLGIFMFFPDLWATITARLGFGRKTHALLESAQTTSSSTLSAVLTGAALGPVFNSCSPTYAWVIASVLPASPARGLFYLSMYCLGLAAALLAISLLGQKLIARLRWAANPRGIFARVIALGFIAVGLIIATGVDRKVQTWAAAFFPPIATLEENLVPQDGPHLGANSTATTATTNPNSTTGAPPPSLELKVWAPELRGIEHWINSEPLSLSQLRGKVVLIDFWTYSCINCIRTQPYLNAWYRDYHDQGLEIIGIHAPEFAFEQLPANVERAVREENIAYPVALDNRYETWMAFRNRYWPAKYLIDQNGTIRYAHFGEGEYEQMEVNIQTLLNLNEPLGANEIEGDRASGAQSPETYLGTARAEGFRGTPSLTNGRVDYSPASELPADSWTLEGQWEADSEKITAVAHGARLSYRFRGEKMFLVMGGPVGAQVKVTIIPPDMPDGAASPTPDQSPLTGKDIRDGVITLDSDRLYELADLPEITDGCLVIIEFPAGVAAHAFTFG